MTSPDECRQRELIEAYAGGRLHGDLKRRAERLLETTETCREVFRRLSAGRFPTIANYTILEQVGKGGFGVVYRAVHHAKERSEALKVFPENAPISTRFFENEVHLVARLRHPNIAILYEAQIETPPRFYAMEFIEGERFNDYIRRANPPLEERLAILGKVVDAIGYAHQRGVVHRDIKPQNVLIDAELEPHLVDFGIGKKLGGGEVDELGVTVEGEQPVGTVGYIAPEQRAGGPVDGRADVFALGALLFYVATGEPARLARNGEHVLRCLREREVSRPEDLAAIIARCVEESPERRYPSCAELAAELNNYVAGRRVHARRNLPRLYRVWRLAALLLRNYPYAVRFLVLALVATGLTAWMYVFGQTSVYARGALDRTMLIGIQQSTLDAIKDGRIQLDSPGFDPEGNSKSLRLLHTSLLRRLQSTKPLVIALDYYYTKCAPEFDPAFADAIRNASAPVIVGAREFDVNGEPTMCDTLRAAVAGVGLLISTNPDYRNNQYEVIHCIQRGYSTPIPSLSLAAYAASRFPAAVPDLRLEPERNQVQVRYRLRQATPGQSNYMTESDPLPLYEIKKAEGGYLLQFAIAGLIERGDLLAHARVPARPAEKWKSRTIPAEQVLTADDELLRRWFDSHAVVIGHMVGTRDQHRLTANQTVYGCQVHAEALDALLASVHQYRMTPGLLGLRAMLWCTVSGLVVTLTYPYRGRGLLIPVLLVIAMVLAGLFTSAWTALNSSELLAVEGGIALSGILIGTSLTWLAKVIGERQYVLSRAQPTPTVDEPLPSTVLAQPDRD